MTQASADVVICGAGIAGVTAAYYLAVKAGAGNVLLVDEREPLSLTSDKSTECYRNWWPGPDDNMVRFMNRSIDLLEALARETSNTFNLNRRGYVFLTGDPAQAAIYERSAREISALGAGPLRVHPSEAGAPPYQPAPAEGYEEQPTGADLVLDRDLIRSQYPFMTDKAVAMLHLRRCGWLSAQQLGMHLLREAQKEGARFHTARLSAVEVEAGRVRSVLLEEGGRQERVATGQLVLASGPLLKETGAMLGLDLPVYNELHGKVAFRDPLGVVPRDLPLMLWSDPVDLPWTDAEREELDASDETRWLLERFPSGVHFRPEGGADSPILLALWTYDLHAKEPEFPPTFEPEYAEVVLRGLAAMIPGLSAYFGRWSQPMVDGGYYCKTRENRPLIGPLPIQGAFVFGALSGFGIMAGMAGGELLAAQMSGSELPLYAPAFLLERYQDASYRSILPEIEASSGQL